MASEISLSWPYPEGEQISAWGTRTSTVNFCEKDYYVSKYIAEFINTVSCLLFLYLSVRGVRLAPTKDAAIYWCYALLAFVGVGSILFHASLKFSMQMVDEMGMLYSTATSCFAIFTISPAVRRHSKIFATALIALVTVLSVVHYNESNPTFHRRCYALMVYGTTGRCFYLLRTVKNPRVKAEMKSLFNFGVIYSLAGTACWLLDEYRCEQLLQIRNIVGLPWGFLFETHGWWHLLTALGSNCFLVFIQYLRLVLMDDAPTHDFKATWKVGCIPHLEAVDSEKNNLNIKPEHGYNGAEKK